MSLVVAVCVSPDMCRGDLNPLRALRVYSEHRLHDSMTYIYIYEDMREREIGVGAACVNICIPRKKQDIKHLALNGSGGGPAVTTRGSPLTVTTRYGSRTVLCVRDSRALLHLVTHTYIQANNIHTTNKRPNERERERVLRTRTAPEPR